MDTYRFSSRPRRNRRPAAATAAFLFLLIPGAAHAYIDPGSGSLIWQILIAGALTVAYCVKRFWHRIAGLFRQSRRSPDQDE